MEEAMVGGYETVIERLERAAGILGGETMAGALGVTEEVVERYLTGEVAEVDGPVAMGCVGGTLAPGLLFGLKWPKMGFRGQGVVVLTSQGP